MAEELTPDERAATVKAMLAQFRTQLFQARVNLAANVGNAAGVAELQKVIQQLRAGIANVETTFGAELAFTPAAEKGQTDATG